MEKRRFQNKVATSGFTLPVAASFTTLLWCAEGIYTLNRLWGWVLCAVMTYLWIETNNAYSLLRIRSRLTSAIFVFLTGCMFSLHPLQDSLFVSCLMLGSYYLIFKSYQQTNVSVCFLHTFLCIGLGSLLFPQLLYFAPFYFWYASVYLRSLTWHSFWAGLTGLILPYWFMAGYALYTGEISILKAHFCELTNFRAFSLETYLQHPPLQAAIIGLIVIFSLVASIHYIRTSFNDKIRTRMFMYLILFQEFLITLFLILQPMHFGILSGLLIMNSAPILSHFFALTGSKLTNAAFILFLVLFTVLSLLNIWIQL